MQQKEYAYEDTLAISNSVNEGACAFYSRHTKEHEHKHCWRIHTRETKRHVVAAERGTGIKMDGANRMLIERSFIFSLYQFGEATRGRFSRAPKWSKLSLYRAKYRTSVPVCSFFLEEE